ncbi:MAG: hypothetical protein ACI9OJ_000030 [Myxococcota bacterium]|jgi:hypothetical protein
MENIKMNDVIPISEFVRNASGHAARIRETGQAEIVTQNQEKGSR